jgi:putative oxidoreductase
MTIALRILHWLCRIILAVVFIYSGYVKVRATLQFAVAITGYKIVPEQFIYPVAQYFPWVEIALGLFILGGWKVRWSSIAAAGLMLFFIVLLSITLFRGIDTNCGCFGFGDPITWKTIARDGSFLIPALYLAYESWIRKGSKKVAPAPSPNAA